MSPSVTAETRYEFLTESQPQTLFLEREEAAALRDLGRRFSESRSAEEREDVQDEVSDSTVLECVRDEESDQDGNLLAYRVVVWNRVGAIQLWGRTLLVKPKIDFEHFVHIVEHAIGNPHTRFDSLSLDKHQSFKDLIAIWFLNSVESLIPNHLIRDYYEEFGLLPAVRGRIDPIKTTRRFLVGKLDVACHYDTLDLDHPLNRILKEACLRIANYSSLGELDRRRARAKVDAMSEVGTFHRSDLSAKPDRRALYEGYGAPLNLARSIIGNEGRSIEKGGGSSYAFLQFTPAIIEEGLRNILIQELGETWRVEKRSYPVQPLKSATPDLVFSRGGNVEWVGDVKYKVVPDWKRLHGDVYQSIYFSAAAEVLQSLIVGFSRGESKDLPRLQVGKNTVDGILWDASPELRPVDARSRFITQVRSVLSHQLPSSR